MSEAYVIHVINVANAISISFRKRIFIGTTLDSCFLSERDERTAVEDDLRFSL